MDRSRFLRFFFLSPDDGGGEGGATPTPAAPATEVAAHVDEAAQGATQAASSTGESGWKTIADELKGLRDDISKLLTGSAPATPAASATATPAAPDVDVEVPKPPVRKVRRGNRKVGRRG